MKRDTSGYSRRHQQHFYAASSDGDSSTVGSDNSSSSSSSGGGSGRRTLRNVATEGVEIPFLTCQLLRLTSTTAAGRLALHPRTVSVAGGTCVVVLGVLFAVGEKALGDDLGFQFPCLVQILAQALTAVVLELFTGRHAFFCRSEEPVRTARLAPLAALYAASMVLAHCARQLQSAHGAYLVAQTAQPIIVMAMMSKDKSIDEEKEPPSNGRRFKLASTWAAVVVAAGSALAAWTPAYSLALVPVGGGREAGSAWARSVLGLGVSMAGALVNAQLLVATANQLAPPQTPARLARHLAPLCMLAALVLWPVVGAPVDAVETLTPRVLLSLLGVALLGALASIARIAMLRADVAGGALGVAVLTQARTLVCLAVGWWAYGFLHWPLQTAGFAIAAAAFVVWTTLRLCAPLSSSSPVLSVHAYRAPRARKLSSASAVAWDSVV
ncbi:hypothetical protein GGI20_002199 [Coemansia sp. BCRC 34301]|nr:hypothetical protein GGI20_002199 [Coemansia sp. BCRC 34301]